MYFNLFAFVVFYFIAISLQAKQVLPLSDPLNQGNWLLNSQLSDEFNENQLDREKWYVQGENNQFYIWKGRAPSQFAPHNVQVENGFLKLTTQWQPDYPFIGKPPKKQNIDKYENITTAAVVSHRTFLYGYMEVRVKIPDAAMTGAFWGTGYQQELDIFELIGRVKKGSRKPETTFVTSIHDWRPGHPRKNKVWRHPYSTPGRTAEHFYTYGVQWEPNGLKMYFEGKLVHQVTQQEMGDAWVLNNPMELWFDSEVFPWFGIPEKQELPVKFEIDYVRVWQKPKQNLLQPAFFGFEGPFFPDNLKKPARREKFAKNWWIDPNIQSFYNITSDHDNLFATGRKSLRLNADKAVSQQELVAYSPYGSINLPAGQYEVSADVWLPSASKVSAFQVILENPWLEITPFNLTQIGRDKWVRVTQKFTRNHESAGKDRMRIRIKNHWLANNHNQLIIDNLAIKMINTGENDDI